MAHEILDNYCVYSLDSEVGGVPWHKLGKGFAQVSSQDVLEHAGFDRTIATMPIRLQAPDGALYSGEQATRLAESIEGFRATVDLKHGRALGVVSDRYQVLQPAELLSAAEFLCNELGAKISCAATLREGRREFISLALPTGSTLTARAGDTIKRYFNLGNGHDGTLACTVGASDVRVVCANTLAAWLSENGSVSIRHRTGVQKALATATYAFTAASETRERFYQELAGRKLSPTDVILYFEAITQEMESTWRETRRGRPSLGKRIAGLLDSPETAIGVEFGYSGLPDTAWDAFNVVTQVATHETSTKDPLGNLLWGSSHGLIGKAERLVRDMFLAEAA